MTNGLYRIHVSMHCCTCITSYISAHILTSFDSCFEGQCYCTWKQKWAGGALLAVRYYSSWIYSLILWSAQLLHTFRPYMHLRLFTPWLLFAQLQRPFGCSPHVQSFAYAGPSSRKHLPLELQLEHLSLPLSLFRKRLKTIFFAWVIEYCFINVQLQL